MNKESPVKAIRMKCLDCCCGSQTEVKECTITDCALYPFRFGKNPYRKGRQFTEEQRIEIGQRLKNYRSTSNVEPIY